MGSGQEQVWLWVSVTRQSSSVTAHNEIVMSSDVLTGSTQLWIWHGVL